MVKQTEGVYVLWAQPDSNQRLLNCPADGHKPHVL